MTKIFEWPHRVAPDETDVFGHANNEAYLRWMNEAALAHSADAGWGTDRYLALGQGWVVKRHEIEYLRPALPNTDIIVRTWVRSFEKVRSWRCYAIHAKGASSEPGILLARGQTLWVWITYKTGHPARIPAEISGSFLVVDESVFELRT